jgi:MFS family permease
MPEHGPRDLWGHADFMRLWSAQAISAFGSRITRTALPIIAVKTLGEPESLIGLLMTLQQAPGVLVALVSGGFVDRSHKRRIMVAMDLVRAGVVASLSVAWALGLLALPHVILVGVLVAAASSLFTITDVAYLPHLVGRHQVAEGNAKLETTEAVAEITGPASAGVLIALLGAPIAVIVNTASYLWSAVMLGRIQKIEIPLEDAPEASSSTWQTTKDLRTGMRAVLGHPQVRPIVLALMVWSIAGGFFAALYALLCLRTLGLSETAFGVIIAMGGVGSLGGAMLSRPLARAIGVGRTIILASAVSTLAGVLMAGAAHVQSRTVVFGFLGAHQLIADGFAVAFFIHAVTLRQTVLPKQVLGRANAAVLVLTTGSLVIATIIAGTLAQLTSIRLAMWVGVFIGLLVPVFVWPLRRVRDIPLPDASSPGFSTGST